VPEDFPLPAELRDRYTVDGELGRGAFGVVLRARDRELERAVAIKLLATQGGAELKERFDREAALLAALEHPGVVRIYDYGHTQDGPYLVMELLEGCTLEDDTAPDLAAVAREVGAALEAIHGAGALHRDVKPGNIMRTRDGRTVLVDLGLARDQRHATLTGTGQLVGTPAYLAPEIWAGHVAGPPADWFALGVSLYEMLEDAPPWASAQLMGGGLPAPSFPSSASAPGLRQLIEGLLAEDPGHRPRSRRDLERLLSRQEDRDTAPSPAASADLTSPPLREARRVPWPPLLFAAGLLIGLFARDATRPAAPAPPPPVREADVRREALDQALEALVGEHRDVHGKFAYARRDASPGEHLPEVIYEWTAPGYGDKLDRFHTTLLAWMEVEPPEAADRHLRQVILPGLDHLAQDRMLLSWYLPIEWAFGSTEAVALHRDGETRDHLERIREELGPRNEETIRALDRWRGREPVLLLIALLSTGVSFELEYQYFLQAQARLRSTQDLGQRADLLDALLHLAPAPKDSGGAYGCPEQVELTTTVAALARELAERPEATSPVRRARLAAVALHRNYMNLMHCRSDGGPEAIDELESLVELAEAQGRDAPAPVSTMLETIALYDQVSSIVFPDLGPRYRPLLERIQRIALACEARLRRVSREVGLGVASRGRTERLFEDLRGLGGFGKRPSSGG
jgi:hypothetical protein